MGQIDCNSRRAGFAIVGRHAIITERHHPGQHEERWGPGSETTATTGKFRLMKLIIHIGSHKTGSTSIQDYAVQHVELLRAHKIAYPIDFFSKYPQQHSEFRDLLADNNVERVKEFFEYAIRDASSHSAKAVFLSGEDLCTLEKNHVHTLYNMLVNLFTDVKVALVLRNKKEYYWSSYKHSLIWAPLRERMSFYLAITSHPCTAMNRGKT